ncbi:MAG: Membrane dipeptidase [Bacteroidetes bacterium]|nr:Membrane dipeptidase [Bacteroidota bacterium]
MTKHRLSSAVLSRASSGILTIPALLLFLSGCSSTSTLQRQAKSMSEAELKALAGGIHERALTMDTHDDISGDFASEKDDESSPENRRQVTLYKMKKGGLDAEFFAVFTGTGERTPDAYDGAYKRAIGLFDAIQRLPQRYPDLVEIATSPADVVRIHNAGKLVACIGMENGYPIGTDIARVKEFYDKGTRYITLTHSGHNQICDSSTPRDDQPKEEYGGLSEFGKQVVQEMNRLGIMVDVSHTSKKATLAALALSKAPIIASHSGASAVNEHARNLDDETLRAIKKNGGVVQLVSLADYIKKRLDTPERLAALDIVRKEFGIPEGRGDAARKAMQALSQETRTKYREKVRELDTRFPRTLVTVEDMVDHIDHITKFIGVDHVGIGTDFDGGGGVTGFNDASESMNITIELVRRGYTEEEIDKIWGENLLRVWKEVERVAGKK